MFPLSSSLWQAAQAANADWKCINAFLFIKIRSDQTDLFLFHLHGDFYFSWLCVRKQRGGGWHNLGTTLFSGWSPHSESSGCLCTEVPEQGTLGGSQIHIWRSQQIKQMPASQGHALSAEERHNVSTKLEGENEIWKQKRTQKKDSEQTGWGRSGEARMQGTTQVKGWRKKSIDHWKAVSHALPDSRRLVTEDKIQLNKR